MGKLLDYIRSPAFQTDQEAKAKAYQETIERRQREAEAHRVRVVDENMITESLNNLLEEGWYRTNQRVSGWDGGGTAMIVLEHPVHTYVLQHTYGVSEDSSDYAGDHWRVRWHKGDVVEVTVRTVKLR